MHHPRKISGGHSEKFLGSKSRTNEEALHDVQVSGEQARFPIEGLGGVYCKTGRYAEAEVMYRKVGTARDNWAASMGESLTTDMRKIRPQVGSDLE
jgi:hypothetical protein